MLAAERLALSPQATEDFMVQKLESPAASYYADEENEIMSEPEDVVLTSVNQSPETSDLDVDQAARQVRLQVWEPLAIQQHSVQQIFVQHKTLWN